ncbi:MAG: hypothetical protein ABI625_28485, partial [bacterium]
RPDEGGGFDHLPEKRRADCDWSAQHLHPVIRTSEAIATTYHGFRGNTRIEQLLFWLLFYPRLFREIRDSSCRCCCGAERPSTSNAGRRFELRLERITGTEWDLASRGCEPATRDVPTISGGVALTS